MIETRIRDHLVTEFLLDDVVDLADDTRLVESGALDSLGVIELVEFLEDEFGIEVTDDEIVPENLDSISRLAAFVRRKRSG